ncbi:hypothetical protein DVA86_14060 [Streptomyces armeniacus]|uniref:Uncharacterized protein n=1 Tax=Streptomyces armeniacus TaxID=83291 RepID=A0A345XPP4_9ACTN|nr:hypothetical protein [Streptomyces armeniacus]AXK33610.1 hypothetical protein DVA86_14060 [Streptomyces armeniacus]
MRKKLTKTLVAVAGVAALTGISGLTAGTAQAAEATKATRVLAPNMDTCIKWGYSLEKTDPSLKAWHCYHNAKRQTILEIVR